MKLKIDWGNLLFGMALGAAVLYVYQNRDTIIWGIENRNKISGAGQVVEGVKKIFG
jgi:hypothetical protein